MSDKIQESKKDKMSFFDYFTEVVGWLQIVASPLLAGLVISALIYFSKVIACDFDSQVIL